VTRLLSKYLCKRSGTGATGRTVTSPLASAPVAPVCGAAPATNFARNTAGLSITGSLLNPGVVSVVRIGWCLGTGIVTLKSAARAVAAM
jgi:hypothetical protein